MRGGGGFEVSGYSINKVCLDTLSLDADEALWYSSDLHGGESEKKRVELRDRMSSCLGNMMLQEQGKHSHCPMFWRQTMMTSWWPLSMPGMMVDASSTSMWRPLFGAHDSHSLPLDSNWYHP